MYKDIKDVYKASREFLRKDRVAKFPPYVTFELSNKCNFKCIMCACRYLDEPKSYMNFDDFKNMIDEISNFGSLIRFIGYEEPLLYPHIKDSISYVKSKGLLLHITSNGSLLDEDLAQFIIQNGVDSIIFSYQGLSKHEYMFMRDLNEKTYQKVISNIKNLFKLRGNRKKPYIKITTTTTKRDDLNLKDNFIKEHLEFSDEVQITGTTHFEHIDKAFNRSDIWSITNLDRPKELKNINCFLPNYEMLIKSDCEVYGCCSAFTKDLSIGNFKQDSLYNIWHSSKATNLRNRTSNGDLLGQLDCKVCPIRFEYESNSVLDLVSDNLIKISKE